MMTLSIKNVLCICTFIICSHLYAQLDSLDLDIYTNDSSNYLNLDTKFSEINDFDIDDLLNKNVYLASKKEEKVADAPGMISHYNAKEIERLGYYTLKDIANITSGYSSFSAYGETNLETRGQKAGSWNVSKHLLLVDGIPINHARANSAPLEYNIPLFFAEKIEFLKGPGSALYGTSAFFGVMSITPKKLSEIGTVAESKLSVADVGNATRMMVNVLSKKDIGQTNVSLSYYKRGFSGDSLGLNRSYKYLDNDNSFFVNASFKFNETTSLKGLGLGVLFIRRNSHGGEFWSGIISPVNEVTWEEFIPYIKYDKSFNTKLHFKSYIKYNSSTEKSTYSIDGLVSKTQNPFHMYNYTTKNIESMLELHYDVTKNASLIGGLNFDTRKETPSPISYEGDIFLTDSLQKFNSNYSIYKGSARVNIISTYLQYQQKIAFLHGLTITAGTRFDYGNNPLASYTQFSPRIAIVQHLTKKINFKALFGQALRVPGIKELGLNIETKNKISNEGGNSSGIADLSPETIKSFEIGLNYTVSKLSIGVALFRNNTINSLDGVSYHYTIGNEKRKHNIFKNESAIISKGVEFDAHYSIKKFRLIFNHSIAEAYINDTLAFINVPSQKSNISISYIMTGKHKFASTIVFRRIHDFKTENINNQPINGKGYSIMDVNFLYSVNTFVSIEFQIRNVLNTKWLQPSLQGTNYMIPLAGRTFMATLGLRI